MRPSHVMKMIGKQIDNRIAYLVSFSPSRFVCGSVSKSLLVILMLTFVRVSIVLMVAKWRMERSSVQADNGIRGGTGKKEKEAASASTDAYLLVSQQKHSRISINQGPRERRLVPL